jgi:hypothetical protein
MREREREREREIENEYKNIWKWDREEDCFFKYGVQSDKHYNREWKESLINNDFCEF